MPTYPPSPGDETASAAMAHRLLFISQTHLPAATIIHSLYPSASAITSAAPRGHALSECDTYVVAQGKLCISDLSQLPPASFNRAMLSAQADAVLLVVDGLVGPTGRDLWVRGLAGLADVPRLIIAIDNLASCDDAGARFDRLRNQLAGRETGIACNQIDVVPVDFARAYNLAGATERPHWVSGPSLRQSLDGIERRSGAAGAAYAERSDQFSVYLSWSGKAPMLPGRHYVFDNGNARLEGNISALKYRFNPETREHQAASLLTAGDVGYANLALEDEVRFCPFRDDHSAGSFRLLDIDSGAEVAFGIINFSLHRAANIRWQALAIDKPARAEIKGQTPCVLWFTGLSGSGKSTIASLIEKQLYALGKHTYVLDGDNVRHGLCRDLGFTDANRVENLRRVGETAKLFVDAGLIVLVSLISPFRAERVAARELFEEGEFIEIFVDTPIEECERRDPKGLYAKARAGRLKNFTGIDSPYEPPLSPDIILEAGRSTSDALADNVVEFLRQRELLSTSA